MSNEQHMNYNANEQRSKPLAIVGYSCCFPGGIDSPDRFWQLLHSGGSVIGEVPDSRLPREFYYVPSEKTRRGKCYSLIGACIDYDHYRNRVNEFLAKIPHSNTFSHDEEHLLSLYVAAEAFRSAGYDPMNIPQRRTGVYVGHSRESKGTVDTNFSSCIESVLEYIEEIPEFAALDKTIRENVWNDVLDAFFRRYPPLSPENRQCLCLHYAAKNISKAFGLSGPAMIFNCACASSLVGIASAADALGQNKIDMALVGGASYVKLESMIHFSKAQALSESGSKPFDSSADGLVPSEGHAYVVLKTLEKALEFGDNVIAVIHGVGVSSDGKGKGLWAPRKEGQLKALQRAYQQTHIRPGDLDYIEAHATSTKRGDATELDTIQSFLKSESVSNKKIFIGSSKANLGHTLESAGLAGLIKILLSMKNETIPAQINIAHLDESFSRNETAIEVPLVNTPWKRSENSPRTAAVSAFGIGGVNAHAIVQDFFDSSSSHNKEKRVSSPPKDNIPIAVIGMGCVLPGVSDLSDFEALLQTGNDPKAASSPDRKELFMNHRRESKRYNSRQNKEMRQLPGGYLTDYSYDWKRHKIPPVQLKHANPLQFIILDAVDKALDDAGFSDALPVPTDTAVVVGSRFDSDYTTALQMSIRCPELEKEIAVQLKNHGVDPVKAKTISGSFSKMLLDRHTALSDETGSFTTTSLAARIVKTYNLMGGYWVIDAGACSSLAALEIAVNALRERRVDMAICVGGQQCMGRLSREEMFLHDGDLFPLAEGAGALVLKRQDDALRDNNHIRALIHGVSFCQGNDMAETTRQSVKATMESSVPNIDTVGFVELASPCNTPASQGHMTGLTEALSSMRRNIPSGSLANQIGNLLGASGIASVIKTILQLKTETARPCAIVTNVDRDGAAGSLLIERCGTVPLSSIISREEFAAVNTAVNGKPPIDAGTTVCQRFVQRIVPAPCATDNVRLGPVLLVGQNAVVEHLYSLIAQSGGTAYRLHPAAPDEPMLRRFDMLFDKEPIRQIVFLTSHDPVRMDDKTDKLDPPIWQKTLVESVYRPFRLLQHWFGRVKSAGLLEQVSVVMSTLLGGDFGYTQPVSGPEGGAAQGLVKALRRELNVQEKILFRSRIVDHHRDIPAEQIAADLFQELLARDLETEIGYIAQQRYTSRPILAPLGAQKVNELEKTAKRKLTGNWIFTGGAQGITAVTAREFGKRFGGSLHLIGSTQRNPAHVDWIHYTEAQLQELKKQVMKDALARKEIPGDAWRRVEKSLDVERNLNEMQKLGINVSYLACDLTDEACVRTAIESIVAAGGPILGVVHGAGFESSCRFERKKRENIARTFNVKVGGAANLMRCLDRHSLKYFVGFGSTSGRFGGVGQSDYSAANEMLAKLLEWYRTVNPDCRTACMQWTAWDDVGMAVRPESKSAITSMNRKFLPSLEGAKHLLDELVLGLPESEVTIVDWDYYKRFFPD